jgi:hypothetical protein
MDADKDLSIPICAHLRLSADKSYRRFLARPDEAKRVWAYSVVDRLVGTAVPVGRLAPVSQDLVLKAAAPRVAVRNQVFQPHYFAPLRIQFAGSSI